jgi:hypothetical protein
VSRVSRPCLAPFYEHFQRRWRGQLPPLQAAATVHLRSHLNRNTGARNLDEWSNNNCTPINATSQSCAITGNKYDDRDIQLELKIIF